MVQDGARRPMLASCPTAACFEDLPLLIYAAQRSLSDTSAGYVVLVVSEQSSSRTCTWCRTSASCSAFSCFTSPSGNRSVPWVYTKGRIVSIGTFQWCSQSPGTSTLWALRLPMLVWNGGILVVGVYFAISIRNFEGVWNESKPLGVVAYNSGLMAVMGVAATYVVVDNANSFHTVLSSVTFLIVTISLGVMFGFKFVACVKQVGWPKLLVVVWLLLPELR